MKQYQTRCLSKFPIYTAAILENKINKDKMSKKKIVTEREDKQKDDIQILLRCKEQPPRKK